MGWNESLITYCAPTLAGLKTGGLFNYPFRNEKEMRDVLKESNEAFEKKGLRLAVVGKKNGRYILYLYRPRLLIQDFQDKQINELLRKLGYDASHISICIYQLHKRIEHSSSFPHEIGLFLGYPLCDVLGFMENHTCLMSGIWKVYQNVEETKCLFEKFQKCTKIYEKCYLKGMALEQLAINC